MIVVDGSQMLLSPSSMDVNVGDTFDVNVIVKTGTMTGAAQCAIAFDPAVAQIDTTNNGGFETGSFYPDWAAVNGGTVMNLPVGTVDNVNGTVDVNGIFLQNGPVGQGPKGTGVLVTYHFEAVRAGNADINLEPAGDQKIKDAANGFDITPLNLGDGTEGDVTVRGPELLLDPSAMQVDVGNKFDVDVLIDVGTSGSMTGAAQCAITFDPAVVQIDTANNGGFETGGFYPDWAAVNGGTVTNLPVGTVDNVNGTVDVNGIFLQNGPVGQGPTGNGILVTYHFEAIGGGNADINLEPSVDQKIKDAVNGFDMTPLYLGEGDEGDVIVTGAQLLLAPSSMLVDKGNTFDVDVIIHSGTMTGAAQCAISFDPGVVQIDTTNNGGFETGSFYPDWAAVNGGTVMNLPVGTVDNVNGTVDVNGIFLQNGPVGQGPDGTGILMTYHFTALAGGNADINLVPTADQKVKDAANGFDITPLNLGDGTEGDVIVTSTDCSITVTGSSSATIADGTAYEMTLELYADTAWTGAGFSGSPVYTFTGSPTFNGNAFSWIAGVVNPGTYDIRLDSSTSLSNARDDVVLTAPATSVDMGQLVEGDSTGDELVDGSDFLQLISAWGTSLATADYNKDGTVDGTDFLELISNWGTSGPRLI